MGLALLRRVGKRSELKMQFAMACKAFSSTSSPSPSPSSSSGGVEEKKEKEEKRKLTPGELLVSN